MEGTLEGGRGPPRAVAPLEEEEDYDTMCTASVNTQGLGNKQCHL